MASSKKRKNILISDNIQGVNYIFTHHICNFGPHPVTLSEDIKRFILEAIFKLVTFLSFFVLELNCYTLIPDYNKRMGPSKY